MYPNASRPFTGLIAGFAPMPAAPRTAPSADRLAALRVAAARALDLPVAVTA